MEPLKLSGDVKEKLWEGMDGHGADVLRRLIVEVHEPRQFCLSQEADLSNQNKQLVNAHFSSSN